MKLALLAASIVGIAKSESLKVGATCETTAQCRKTFETCAIFEKKKSSKYSKLEFFPENRDMF